MSSASEDEDSDDSDSRDIGTYACNHCFTTTSKEWHPTGKDRLVLCTECKTFYKKFGELRPLPEARDQQSANFLFKPVKNEDDNCSISNGKHNMRTRRSKEKNQSELNRSNSKSSEPNSPERTDSLTNSKTERKSPIPLNCENNSNEKKNLVDISLNTKKRIGSDFPELDEINSDSLTPNKRKKMTNDENGRNVSSPSESFSTESSSMACNEENALNENYNEEPNGENVSSPHSPLSSQSERSPNQEPDKNLETADALLSSNETNAEATQIVSEDDKLRIPKIIETENSEKSVTLSQSSIEPKSPATDQLITPKLEPPSSPKSPPEFPASPPLTTNTSDTTCPVPSNTTPTIAPSPPMRIKEEISYPKSPPQSFPLGPIRSGSPLADRMFPFMGSQPMANITHRLTNSPLPQHPIVGESFNNSNKESMTPTSDATFHKKSSKDRRSLSPKGSGSPSVSSIAADMANIPISVTSSISTPESLFQPSYTTPTTPSEQRLPAMTSPHHHHNHLANLQTHPNLTPPGLSPHMMPPAMPPYFPTSWSPYSSRPILPPHLGFSGSPFPPVMSTSGQMQSPHNNSMSKPKSPITSQQNLISHSPSQFTAVQSHISHLSKHDNNKYDLNQVSNRETERRDREHPHEDEEIEPTPIISRGPSPEPKIEDSECHRSQSAMY